MQIAFKDGVPRNHEVVKVVKTYWRGKTYEWTTYDLTKKKQEK